MKPTGTCVRRAKLCSSRPAPTSSISDSATSAMTRRVARTARAGGRRAPRPPLFSASTGDCRAASDEGTRPKSEAGDDRNGEREREHAAVDRDLGSARQARAAPTRRRRRSRTRAARRARPPASASSRLSLHIQRVRSQRLAPSASAHRGLVRSRRRADEQQVGDVGARDQQHEPDRAHQHQQRRPGAADRPLADRHQPEARVRIGSLIVE